MLAKCVLQGKDKAFKKQMSGGNEVSMVLFSGYLSLFTGILLESSSVGRSCH